MRFKNEPFCFDFTHLGGYYFILCVVLIFEVIRLVEAIVIIVEAEEYALFISVTLSLVFIILELCAITYVRELLKLLKRDSDENVAAGQNNTSDENSAL